jgi:hypothetical protein
MSAVELALRDNPDVDGVFPRWISLASVSNPKNLSVEQTGSFVTYGD